MIFKYEYYISKKKNQGQIEHTLKELYYDIQFWILYLKSNIMSPNFLITTRCFCGGRARRFAKTRVAFVEAWEAGGRGDEGVDVWEARDGDSAEAGGGVLWIRVISEGGGRRFLSRERKWDDGGILGVISLGFFFFLSTWWDYLGLSQKILK